MIIRFATTGLVVPFALSLLSIPPPRPNPPAPHDAGSSPTATRAAASAPDWFLPDGPVPTPKNEVVALVDGPDTLKSMVEAIGKARPRLVVRASFGGFSSGGDYQGPIALGPDGNLYGTSPASAKDPTGSIYKVTPDGRKTVLAVFAADVGLGAHGLTVAPDGTLYGICSGGGKYGQGTVWSLAPGAAKPDVMWDFRSGKIVPALPYPKQPTRQQILDAAGGFPQFPPVFGRDGMLYGVTPNGSIYSIPPHSKDALHGIALIERKDMPEVGALPTCIIQAADGNLYGATIQAAAGSGAIFKVSPGGGPLTSVHKFDYQHGAFADSLTQADDGTLYGTCRNGGPGANPGNGLVFEASTGGEYIPRHYFYGDTGSHPIGGVTVGKDGYLYGTASGLGPYGRGVLYRLSRKEHHYEKLHAFGGDDAGEGRNPAARPLLSADGKKVYGTTSNYGEGYGGSLWSYDLGTPDFIYAANWWFDPSFPLLGAGSPKMDQLLVGASRHDVQIRAMLWKQPNSASNGVVNWFNTLVRGAAILDDRTLDYGSHHQKLLVVDGSDGLTAFTGGVDINLDRIAPGINGSPLHDVHCRVRGPAAQDLLNIFLQRWDDHPDHKDLDDLKGPLVATKESGAKAEKGTCWVQVGRTFGNGSAHAGVSGVPFASGGYKFAPKGEQTAAAMITYAIFHAKKSIYVEDQYFVDTTDPAKPGPYNVRVALMTKLADPNFKQLVVLIPDGSITDMGFVWTAPLIGTQHRILDNQVRYRRRLLIEALKKARGGNKVHVYCLKDPGKAHTYVHAKTWMFDDEYAIIGSANTNRRSWTHDSEAVVGIYDTGSQDGSGYPLPKHLRMRLWAEHLGYGETAGHWDPAPGYEAALSDPLKPGLWPSSATNSTRVMPYDENVDSARNLLWVLPDTQWNVFADPDGS